MGERATLPRSSTKTSLTVSFVREAVETSAEIQPSSLSGNQTRVPLLYMFSAMAGGRGPSGGRAGRNKSSAIVCVQLQLLN